MDRLLTGIATHTRGVRQLRRPAVGDSPAFDLSYVRTGPRGGTPALVIPGGPGLGSILPYRTLRGIAARGGLDLIMVEHRGVGLSRTDLEGRDLPLSAMRIAAVVADLAAVLDHEGVESAHIVGSSYGSYLASSFGVAHPERVAGMLLDSALQSADHIDIERAAIRNLFWLSGGERAGLVRRLVETGADQRVLLDVIRAAYELGGDELLMPLLRRRLRSGRDPAWKALEIYATRDASVTSIPGIYEFDLVGEIGFRELGYGGEGDGLPLDPALTYAPLAYRYSSFAGEPFDLAAGASDFEWPLVLLSGTRDLRTPPIIAERIAAATPQSVFVSIENGHSALDTQPAALLNALKWLRDGKQGELPNAQARLDGLPRRGFAARMPRWIRGGLHLEELLRP